jgi:hypothetical protein
VLVSEGGGVGQVGVAVHDVERQSGRRRSGEDLLDGGVPRHPRVQVSRPLMP